MIKLIKNKIPYIGICSMALVMFACNPEEEIIETKEVIVDALVSEADLAIPDAIPLSDSDDDSDGGTLVTPKFAAEIVNGSFNVYTDPDEDKSNIGAWSVDPDSTLEDAAKTPSPYDFWSNSTLKDAIRAYDSSLNEKISVKEGDPSNLTAQSGRFDDTSDRLYQPIRIEKGVGYTIEAYFSASAAQTGGVAGTFYILHTEIANETSLAANSVATYEAKLATAEADWNKVSFDFTVDKFFAPEDSSFNSSKTGNSDIIGDLEDEKDSQWVIVYFVPVQTITGKVYVDDISIITKGI